MYFAIFKQTRKRRGMTPKEIPNVFAEGDSEEAVATSLGLEIFDKVVVHGEVVNAWRKKADAKTDYFLRERDLSDLGGSTKIEELR